MWKLLAKSVQGSGHKRLDLVCQDCCLVQQYQRDGETFLVLSVSDGAGSAELSDAGSQIACQVIHAAIAQSLMTDFPAADELQFTRAHATGWYASVCEALEREADRRSVPVRQLACTLLVAIIGESSAAFCQIGDGAIVVGEPGALRPVFWPQSGEYANTTNFVVASRIEQDLMFEVHETRFDDVALLTDGLQSVALNYATRQAHSPFFKPLLESLRNCPDPAELAGPMQTFLESKNLAERTDDDLTLVLATRPPA